MTLIDPVVLKARLGVLSSRFDVDALEECDSTNSELMRRADRGAPSGTVIVADRQSAGRGRRGRTWLSKPADSLTFSLLWRFPGDISRLSGLSLAIGLGLVKGLASLGVQGVRLKWPNDILLESPDGFAKLAGVLVELAGDRKGTQAIIGVGLNLARPEGTFPQAVAGLTDCCRALPERNALLAALLSEMAGVLEVFTVDGFLGLKTQWQFHHAWQGLPVQILAEGAAALHGTCLGVDDAGSLLLDTGHGVEHIYSGDVSLRRL